MYINYSTRRSFVTVQPQKRKVLCYVSLVWKNSPKGTPRSRGMFEVLATMAWVTLRITLSDATQLDYVLRAVESSYHKAHQ